MAGGGGGWGILCSGSRLGRLIGLTCVFLPRPPRVSRGRLGFQAAPSSVVSRTLCGVWYRVGKQRGCRETPEILRLSHLFCLCFVATFRLAAFLSEDVTSVEK